MSTSKIAVAVAVVWIGAVVAVEAASSPPADARRLASPSDCSGAPPPGLAVPEGNGLAFGLLAEGVQIYACASSSGAPVPAWTLKAPEATLEDERGARAGAHRAGPTWQALDGSAVVGAKVQSATPDPRAIPWLLLRAASHSGTGRMGDVTFVQRIGTSGGLAPSEGCSESTVGTLARVPYRAVYCFYRRDGAHP